jgi:hypothetical protein
MATKNSNAKRSFNCTCCGERVRKFEPMVIGLKISKGKIVEDNSERYCTSCTTIAVDNCYGSTGQTIDNEHRAETMRERWASYDNKQAFWSDLDARLF